MTYRPRFFHVFFLLVLALAVTLSLPTPSPAQSRGNLPPDLRALIDEALQANPEVKQKAQLKSPPRRRSAPPGPWTTPNYPSTS